MEKESYIGDDNNLVIANELDQEKWRDEVLRRIFKKLILIEKKLGIEN